MGIIVQRPPPCSACHSLGAFEDTGIHYDLYFCLLRLHSIPIVDPDWPTVLARFGDGPTDFKSGMALVRQEAALAEAERRAIDRGLYEPKKPLHSGMQQVVGLLADLIIKDIETQLALEREAASAVADRGQLADAILGSLRQVGPQPRQSIRTKLRRELPTDLGKDLHQVGVNRLKFGGGDIPALRAALVPLSREGNAERDG